MVAPPNLLYKSDDYHGCFFGVKTVAQDILHQSHEGDEASFALTMPIHLVLRHLGDENRLLHHMIGDPRSSLRRYSDETLHPLRHILDDGVILVPPYWR